MALCSVSESKRQNAAAIWTHMDPVLRDIQTKYPSVTTVHFWSDGPSKQYKNKNFYLVSEVPPTLGFSRTTWNYFPTSHGKGAPDGIGGTVKRTADSLLPRENDVPHQNCFCSEPLDCQCFSPATRPLSQESVIYIYV